MKQSTFKRIKMNKIKSFLSDLKENICKKIFSIDTMIYTVIFIVLLIQSIKRDDYLLINIVIGIFGSLWAITFICWLISLISEKMYRIKNVIFKNHIPKKEHENEINEYEQRVGELKNQLENLKNRKSIYNYRIETYDIRVIKEGEEKDFPHPARVLVSTHQIIIKDKNGQIKEVEKKPNLFYLLEFYWNNGGWCRFYNISGQNNLLYKLDFHKYISCIDSHGKKYQVLLTSKKELWKKWDLDNLTDLKKQLNKIYDKRNSEFKKAFNDKKTNYPYLAKLVSEFEEYFYNKIADELETKKHPASKSAEQVRELAQKIKQVKKENIILEGKLAEYEKIENKN